MKNFQTLRLRDESGKRSWGRCKRARRVRGVRGRARVRGVRARGRGVRARGRGRGVRVRGGDENRELLSSSQ